MSEEVMTVALLRDSEAKILAHDREARRLNLLLIEIENKCWNDAVMGGAEGVQEEYMRNMKEAFKLDCHNQPL